jgi:hypothetical protein
MSRSPQSARRAAAVLVIAVILVSAAPVWLGVTIALAVKVFRMVNGI